MTQNTEVLEKDSAALDAPRRSADRIVEYLEAQGVKQVFAIPGAKVDQLFDALLDSNIHVVVCRHEQNAAFMAACVGRLTGQPGVAVVTSGPGTTNLATGLLTASAEGDPMVALCGAVPRADRLKTTHQSMDAASFLKTVAKYANEVESGDTAASAVANAFRRSMLMPRGASALVFPSDVLAEKTTQRITRPMTVPSLGAAPVEALDKAAELIKNAKFPVVLVGDRAACTAGAEAIQEFVRTTGLPVVETFQGAGVLSEDLADHFYGRVGLFRNQPGDIALDKADVVLTIGYDSIEYDANMWNVDDKRSIIALDEVAVDIALGFEPELEVRGSIPATVKELGTLLGKVEFSEETNELLAGLRKELEAPVEPTKHEGDGVLDPVAATLALREAIPAESVVTVDIGSVYIYMARYFRSYKPRKLLFSDGQQTLGVALPWGIAASMVNPDQPAVSISGDGGFLFSANELETAVREKSNLVHVIFEDGTYDMVAFQQQNRYGRTSGINFGPIDAVKYAEAFGAHGHRVSSPEELVETMKQALAEEGPSIVAVPVDYSRNADYLAHQLRGELVD